MRLPILALVLAAACGRSDIVVAPPGAVVERELELDDGDVVWVEVHPGGDAERRAAFLAVEDGVSLDGLVEAIAHGEPARLVLDTTDEPVLVVEIEDAPVAFIWR